MKSTISFPRITLFIFLFAALILETSFKVKLSGIPGISFKNLAIYLMLVVIILGNNANGIPIFGKNKLNLPILLFIIYCFVSLISTHLMQTVQDYALKDELIFFKAYMEYFLMFIVTYNLVHERDTIKALLFLMLFVSLILNIMTILGSLDLIKLSRLAINHHGRTEGALGEANQYAAFVGLFLPFSLNCIIVYKQIIVRVVMTAISLIALLALLLTGSRGGLLAVFVGLNVLLLLNTKKLTSAVIFKVIFLWVFVGFLLITAFYFLPDSSKSGLEENIFGRAEKSTLSDYSSGRLEVWLAGLSLFMQNPVIGTGWHTFSKIVRVNSHNDFILYLTTTGMIGFLLFSSIFYRLAYAARLFRRRYHGSNLHYYNSYFAGLISFIVAMFFVNIFLPFMFFFIYSGLIIKMGFLAEKIEQTNKG